MQNVRKETIREVIVDYLKEQRNPKKRDSVAKRRKLNVIPGRSVAFEDSPEKEEDECLPTTSKVQRIRKKIVEQSKSEQSFAEEKGEEREEDAEEEREV